MRVYVCAHVGSRNGNFLDFGLKQDFFSNPNHVSTLFFLSPRKRGMPTAGTAKYLLVRPSDQGWHPGSGERLWWTQSLVSERLHAGTALRRVLKLSNNSWLISAPTESMGMKYCGFFYFQKRYVTEITHNLSVGD